ncbi:MAG: phosphoglycerate kinase [Polyangiaceae bacterium]|nr:phosphoglycerate kinase [Polyangiaceae bacterium]
MANKLFIENVDVTGKRALVRVDFNVPLKDGVVENDKRIQESLPTIKYLCSKGAKVILMSHLGRPDGERKPELSLRPVAKALSALLGAEVAFVEECVGAAAEAAVNKLSAGSVLLLENVRFHWEEEYIDKPGKEDPTKEAAANEFARKLATLGDLYINDAFGTAHRKHGSTARITAFLKPAAAGYLMKKELDYLGGALTEPKRPFVAVIGGSKVSSKLKVLESLLPRVDKLLIGGGMTYTFLKAKGLEVGNSICELDQVEKAQKLLASAPDKIVLGEDFVVTEKLDFDARTVSPTKVVPQNGIAAGWEAVDIGPASTEKFSSIIASAKTVLWNGPVGVFEIDAAARGTIAVAEAMARATAAGATTVVGGGDSASAVKKAKVADKVSHVSTGGGASLEFLESFSLVGVEALSNA